MSNKRLVVMLWILCAGLWSTVLVDKCGGDDGSTTVTYGDNGKASAGLRSYSDSSSGPEAGLPAKDTCVNINLASASELTSLPGIGPVIAGRIIDSRKRHGPFVRLADLDRVKGIGPATLHKIEKRICF